MTINNIIAQKYFEYMTNKLEIRNLQTYIPVAPYQKHFSEADLICAFEEYHNNNLGPFTLNFLQDTLYQLGFKGIAYVGIKAMGKHKGAAYATHRPYFGKISINTDNKETKRECFAKLVGHECVHLVRPAVDYFYYDFKSKAFLEEQIRAQYFSAKNLARILGEEYMRAFIKDLVTSWMSQDHKTQLRCARVDTIDDLMALKLNTGYSWIYLLGDAYWATSQNRGLPIKDRRGLIKHLNQYTTCVLQLLTN